MNFQALWQNCFDQISVRNLWHALKKDFCHLPEQNIAGNLYRFLKNISYFACLCRYTIVRCDRRNWKLN